MLALPIALNPLARQPDDGSMTVLEARRNRRRFIERDSRGPIVPRALATLPARQL